MAQGLLAVLRQWFEGEPSVRKVADDPALSAEILLMFRMVLADGQVQEAELATLKRICRDAFDIDEEGFRRVMRFLHDYAYETTTAQALDVFKETPRERRVELARHMAEIAKADSELSQHEVRLLRRTLDALGLASTDAVPDARH